MGWQLNSSVDWMPVSISKIRQEGALAAWNKQHPESKVLPGDEIIQVNKISWQHNTKAFAQRIKKYLNATDESRSLVTMKIQRPRSVVDKLEDQVFSKDFNVWLALNGTTKMGWQLNA